MIHEHIQKLAVPILGLRPFEGNPRQGDVGAIVVSLERHGQYRPIVVNARTREVLAGNHTLEAARQLGWSEIAATFVDVDADTAARIVLIDNRSNDLASYDDAALSELLLSLPDLEGTGYDGSDLDELLQVMDPKGWGSDTEPVDVPAVPVTEVGDLLVLGDHRLVCGDATNPDAVARVLDGGMPDLLVTDPPYGVAYESRGRAMTYETKGIDRRHRPIANDGLPADGTGDLTHDALAISGLKAGGAFYVFAPSGPMVEVFLDAIGRAVPDGLRQMLVWVKSSFSFGRSDYHYRHEFVLYGWQPGAGHYFVEDRGQDSVLEYPKPARSDDHPTMKPVELCERLIVNSSHSGELVYEPFAGSGSTLIACENRGRRCAAVELDPGYCDVIVDRWERHTGRTAERVRDGSSVEAHA